MHNYRGSCGGTRRHQMKKLINKTVFITGGLSGIGKECAFAAANEGANIVIADLESDAGGTVLKELKLINSKAVFIQCDVSVFEQVQMAVQKAVSTSGMLEVPPDNDRIDGESAGEMPEHAWLKVIAGFQMKV